MALYALYYRYVDDVALVSQHRPEHRQYLSSLFENGKLLAAGPLDDPDAPSGLLILDVDSEEEAHRIAQNDPFSDRGVIVRFQIASWSLSFGGDRFSESKGRDLAE